MATFVLVHGATVGGWCWRWVAKELRSAGHEVHSPMMTGLGERVHLATPDVDLDTHLEDIVDVLRFNDLTAVILVGWGYGGMVVAGVVDRIPERSRTSSTSIPMCRATAARASFRAATPPARNWRVPTTAGASHSESTRTPPRQSMPGRPG